MMLTTAPDVRLWRRAAPSEYYARAIAYVRESDGTGPARSTRAVGTREEGSVSPAATGAGVTVTRDDDANA